MVISLHCALFCPEPEIKKKIALLFLGPYICVDFYLRNQKTKRKRRETTIVLN